MDWHWVAVTATAAGAAFVASVREVGSLLRQCSAQRHQRWAYEQTQDVRLLLPPGYEPVSPGVKARQRVIEHDDGSQDPKRSGFMQVVERVLPSRHP